MMVSCQVRGLTAAKSRWHRGITDFVLDLLLQIKDVFLFGRKDEK